MKQHPHQRRWRTAHLAVGIAVFFSTASAFLRADELPGPLTLDIPVPMNLATPAWLGHPSMPEDTLKTLALPIAPPNADAALLITVYFTESDNGFLRINWKPAVGTPVALATNFYEGVGMATSRSLLVPPSTLGTGGYLVLQGNAVSLGIQRVEFEWLQSRQDLVAPSVSAMLLTTSDGKTVPAETVDGQPTALTGTWTGNIVTVPIQADPARIETGVEFSVDLDKLPTTARLILKETGLSLTQHLVVWLNEKRAGTITPIVPGLSDAGFFTDPSSTTSFVGWRNGSFYVPVSALKQGTNTLQFSAEDEVAPPSPAPVDPLGGPPLAVKEVALQMNYTAAPDPIGQLPLLHLSVEPTLLSPVAQTSTN